MEQSPVHGDNQQERSLFDIGWLAGIIDGEGCLQLVKQVTRDSYHYRPQVVISNTNKAIIDKVIDVMGSYHLPHYVLFREKPSYRSKRPGWTIIVYGFKRCERLLLLIGEYLIGKAEQAQIMRDFIDYRFSLPRTSPPTGQDEQFKQRMTEANQRHKGEILRDFTLGGAD